MKKIYLLTLGILIGNFWMLSATNPQNATNHYGTDGRAVLSPNNGRPGPHAQYRQPSGSNQSFSLGCIYSDNFDGANDTTSLKTRGYHVYYRGGGAQGTAATWFQGSPGTFGSLNGPIDGYLASNFNSVTGANNIDNWLVLPSLTVDSGDVMSFYSQAPLAGATPFVDSLHVYYSAAGDTTPEATSWVLLGEFEVNSIGIWEFKKYTVPASSANGRLAIRYAVVDGGPSGANSNYIGIDQLDVYTPSVDDIQAFVISAPSSDCQLSATENITVAIVNAGTSSLSNILASFTVDSGTAVIETIPGPLAAGDTIFYTFTGTADLSAQGVYDIQVGATTANDTNLCNNTWGTSVTNIIPTDPIATPFLMGFESTEDFSLWIAEDVNADAVTWAPINTLSHSGTMCMRKAGSGTSDDDWLFTSCLDLTSGVTYHLDYWFKEFDLTAPCGLETAIATAPNSSSVSTLINTITIPSDTTYQHSIETFTVATSGIYYLGFHATAAAGSASLRIDDINIDNGNFIGINENKAKTNVNIYPNPANGLFYVSSHLSVKNALIEVFNIQGQKVYTANFDNADRQFINMYNQANGVYNIRITSDTFVENHSIVINK